MSTTYYRVRDGYRLSAPWKEDGLTLWEVVDTHHNTVAAHVYGDSLSLVADRDEKAAHSSGGSVMVYATGPDAEWVISEYGEAVRLGDLRRKVEP